MNTKAKSVLLSEKKCGGFWLSDLLGVVMMLIPFIISVLFNHIIPGKSIWFLQISSEKVINIRPGLVSGLCAAAFYAALIVRFPGIFRMNNLFEAIVSITRTFLNCWVIAAIVSLVIPTTIPKGTNMFSVFFNNPESTLLLFSIILSWLGMKVIAGYSWILFIIAAWKQLLIVNSAMNMWGTVFVLAFAISLFLQIRDYTAVKDFARNFRTKALDKAEKVKENVTAAADDASQKVQDVKNFVKDEISAHTGVPLPSSKGAQVHGGVRINLDALDLNKDGVVDEKDFMILQKTKEEKPE